MARIAGYETLLSLPPGFLNGVVIEFGFNDSSILFYFLLSMFFFLSRGSAFLLVLKQFAF